MAIRFSVRVDDDLVALADREARRTRTTRTSVVNRALEAYLIGGATGSTTVMADRTIGTQNRTEKD